MKKMLSIAAMMLGLMSVQAQAAPLKWTLSDVEFNTEGPGLVSGNFSYDAVSNEYSDLMLTIAGTGTSLDGFYSEVFPGTSQNFGFLAVKSLPAGLGSASLLLSFIGSLARDGGSVPVWFTGAAFCDDADCTEIDPNMPERFGDSGTVTAHVPLPAAGLLLLGALGGIAGLHRLYRH